MFDLFSLGRIPIGAKDLTGFERHGMHAGHPFFQAVFSNLVMKPRNEARVDRNDPQPLTQLAAPKHRRLAQGDHRNVHRRTCLVKAYILEVT